MAPFSPADELLYLALHGVRHRYERLSHILDLAFAHHHLAAGALRQRVAPLADLMTLGTLLTAKLRPAPPQTRVPHPRAAGIGPSTSTPPARPHLSSLADHLWQHLLTHPATPTDWKTLHRFYLHLEPTLRGRLTRRLRHLRILATRITEPDRAFASRLGLRKPWHAYLLRSLRLLAGTGSNQPAALSRQSERK